MYSKIYTYRSKRSKVYKSCCWDCNDFYIGKTKRRLHDRKTRLNFKSLTKNDHSLAIADHVTATGHNIKWDHFEILASGKTDYHCSLHKTLSQLLMSRSAVKSCFISCICLLYFFVFCVRNFLISRSHFQSSCKFLNV